MAVVCNASILMLAIFVVFSHAANDDFDKQVHSATTLVELLEIAYNISNLAPRFPYDEEYRLLASILTHEEDLRRINKTYAGYLKEVAKKCQKEKQSYMKTAKDAEKKYSEQKLTTAKYGNATAVKYKKQIDHFPAVVDEIKQIMALPTTTDSEEQKQRLWRAMHKLDVAHREFYVPVRKETDKRIAKARKPLQKANAALDKKGKALAKCINKYL